MERDGLPEDPAQQWEVLLYIIAFEEKKNERKLDGPIQTVTYVFNHKGIRHIFTEWMNQMKLNYDKTTDDESSVKSDAVSLIWRKRGNIKYKEENFQEAYKFYNKSVVFADKKGPLYPLALANRSAAALKLKKIKESMIDVQRALNHKYPEDLQSKLHVRRAECFVELGQIQNAIEALGEALRHNQLSQLKGQAKADFDKMYQAVEAKIATPKHQRSPVALHLPELANGENPNFKNACSAVELTQKEEVGRHVLVKDEVKRGDVLFSEEPFAAVRLRENELPHPFYCDYCCSSDSAMIGCNDCSRVVYCDEACHFLGRNMYHQWECPGVRSKIFSVVGMAHLAFRVMIKYAYRGFPRLPASAGTPKTAAALMAAYSNVDKVDIYKKDTPAFYAMFNLQYKSQTPANIDSIQYALSSTMLVMYLEQNTTFFEYFPETVGYPLPLDEMKLLCAALIHRTLLQLVTNAHIIMELNINPVPKTLNNDSESMKALMAPMEPWRQVGTGVYPTCSMMNHSCEPNITNLFYKTHLYVKAIRELPRGAEVLNCYGPHYARATTEARREELLTQYGFNCVCPACVDETRKDFVSLFTAYSCPSCKGPVTWVGTRMNCHSCPNEFPLQRAQNAAETADAMHAIVNCKRCLTDVQTADILRIFRRGVELIFAALRATDPQESCDLMMRAHRLMQQVLYRHHNTLRRVVDDMARLYAAVGDYSKGIDLIKQNIQSFEYQYGSFSVEVTNEIRKMANLMVGRIMKFFDDPHLDDRQAMPIRDWVRETLKIVKKANQLMELNFGTWPEMYKSLRENEDILENILAMPRFHDHTDCYNQRLQKLNFV